MNVYFRKITALLPKKLVKNITNSYVVSHVRTILFVMLVIGAGILLQMLVYLNQRTIIAKKDYEVKIKEFNYWSSVASQFPNIPDILYNASLSALSIGKTKEALRLIDKALIIDPVFKKARDLRNEIVGG